MTPADTGPGRTGRRPDLRLAVPALVSLVAAALAAGRPPAVSDAVGGVGLAVGLLLAVRNPARRPRRAEAAAPTARAAAGRAGAAGSRAGAAGSGSSAAGSRAGAAAAVLVAVGVTLLVTGVHRAAVHPAVVRQMLGQPVARPVTLVAAGDAVPPPSTVSDGRLANTRVPVLVTGLTAGGTRWRLRVPALLFGADPRWQRLRTGQRTTAQVRLVPSTDPALAAVLFADGAPGRIAPAGGLARAAAAVRDRLRLAAAALPADRRALFCGLVDGDDAGLPPELAADIKTAGLTHLVAVSGSNLAVVLAAVLGLAGAVGLGRRRALLLGSAALAGFVLVAGGQPSVLRAAVMAAVVLVAQLLGRPRAALPALAAAVLILLWWNPFLARSVGFLLSAAATAGLLLLAPPVRRRLERWLPARVAAVVAVPLAAQLACLPIIALVFGTVSAVALPANLLVAPVVPAATLLGFLAALLAWPLLPVARVAAGLAGPLVGWIPAVAHRAAGLPGAALPWPAGWAGAVLLVPVAAGLVLLVRSRPVALVALTAGAVLVPVAAVGHRYAGWPPPNWVFAACDVGQGDGLVLNGGGGHYAVVDTGREDRPIAACLSRLGVGRIDLLVLPHWDADHVGAARSLAGRVGTALVGPTDGGAAVALRGDLAAAGAHVRQTRRGDAVRLGRLRLDVLWPPEPLGGVEPGNAASITLHVTGGGASLLLTGDLGEEAQDALLAAGPLPRVDVVKVAHHGSADQSPALYAAAGAAFGIVSVGADNDYGHPTRRLLGILRATGTRAVRTDQDGLVLVSWAGGKLVVWSERPVTAAVWTPAERVRAHGRQARSALRAEDRAGAVGRRAPGADRPRLRAGGAAGGARDPTDPRDPRRGRSEPRGHRPRRRRGSPR